MRTIPSTRHLVAAATLLLALAAQSVLADGGVTTGGASGAPPAAGGASVVANLNCRSFGQTASNGGILNIKYATPVMCFAGDSTVNGQAINGASGWVDEAIVQWDWDDNSLGTVTRAGRSVDLGESWGVVAAHAFRPSTYGETCNCGTNSLHTVRGTVYAVVSGVRVSGTNTLTVCVEDPETTWPTPKAYCDDSNCADDAGVPAGTVHGGNGTDLATILQDCATNGSERIVLEGGVTFTTASLVSVGQTSCLVESYGTGRAKLKFTNSASDQGAIRPNHANCAGYRIHNVTFAGNGGNPQLIEADAANTGCLLLLDWDLSATAGEELEDYHVNDPTGVTVAYELYDFLGQMTTLLPGSANTSTYVWCYYCAWVGGDWAASGSHMMRIPQWNWFVLDAMKFRNQVATRSLLTLRQDCGGATCTNFASAQLAAITRSEFIAGPGGAAPLEVCQSGGGGSPEPTQCRDIDWLFNLFTMSAWDATQPTFFTEYAIDAAGGLTKQVRYFGNAADMSGFDTSTASRNSLVNTNAGSGSISHFAFGNNVVICPTCTSSSAVKVTNLSIGSTTILKNNACYEDGAGSSCNLFPNMSESSSDNLSFTSDPFNAVAGEPPAHTFGFPDLKITSGNATLKGQGVVSALPVDFEGEAIPQSSDYDVGVDDE